MKIYVASQTIKKTQKLNNLSTQKLNNYEIFPLEAGAGAGRDHHHRYTDNDYYNGLRGLLVLLMWTMNVSFL